VPADIMIEPACHGFVITPGGKRSKKSRSGRDVNAALIMRHCSSRRSTSSTTLNFSCANAIRAFVPEPACGVGGTVPASMARSITGIAAAGSSSQYSFCPAKDINGMVHRETDRRASVDALGFVVSSGHLVYSSKLEIQAAAYFLIRLTLQLASMAWAT